MLLKKLINDPIGYCLDSQHAALRMIGRWLLAREKVALLAQGAKMQDRKVAVVLTCYQTEAYVGDAVRSILAQTHENLSLLIVDDASDDATVARALEAAAGDPRVSVYRSKVNHGTYWSKNWAIARANADFIATHDSDDISAPDRLQLQLGAFASFQNPVAVIGRWDRVNESGEPLLIDGKQDRMSAISTMFHRAQAIESVGFFDSVRISADIDFIERLKLAFGSKRVKRLRHVIYQGRLRSDSLTRGAGSGFEWVEDGNARKRRTVGDRRIYDRAAKAWRDQKASSLEQDPTSLRVAFPPEERHFPVPASLLKGADDDRLDTVEQVQSNAAGQRAATEPN